MAKYYIDTSIWIDYYENRKDKFRLLGEWALLFINKVKEEQATILVSNIVIDELEQRYDKNEVQQLLGISKENIQLISTSKAEAREAATIKNTFNIPFADALHAILARNHGAILIARDKHFWTINGLVKINRPEELL